MAVNGSHIHWANSGGNTIGRAGLDGSGVENDFITGAHWPCGVSVDGAHVYWGNSAADGSQTNGPAIGRANLDGSEVDQAFVTGIGGVCGVALDP